MLRHVASAGTWLLVLALAGCAAKHGRRSPEAVLIEFRQALERGDTQAAYELLSDDARALQTRAQFEAALRDNPKEASALTKALGQPGPARVVAQVSLASDAQPIQLEQDPQGAFRIASPIVAFYPQENPREALLSFVRAVENTRWDVVLGLMPAADRAGLDAAQLGQHLSAQTEELTRLVALLRSSLDAPIEIVGDRATMPYGESYTARLVREDDGWKIEDPG